MALQLLACFEYCEIEFTGIDDQVLAELKKMLLLDLKASGNDTIVIDGETYSKNDILEFFERQDFLLDKHPSGSETPPHQAVVASATWHSVLAKPELLVTFFEIPDELLDRDKLEEARKMVEQLYGKEIIRVAQRQFRDGEYDRLQYILSYEPVFSNSFAYDLKHALYLLFKNQLLKIESETLQQAPLEIRNTVFFNRGFYRSVHFIKDIDSDIARQVMRAAVERSRGRNLTWKTKKELFEQFFQLPLDPEGEAYVKKNIAYFEERIREEEEDDKSLQQQAERILATSTQRSSGAYYGAKQTVNNVPSSNEKGRAVGIALGIVAAIVIGVSMVARLSSSRSSASDRTVTAMLESARRMAEEMRVDYYFEKDDVIRDYKELKASLETSVTHPKMSAFLVNALSRFCYDEDADSTQNRLTFVPIKSVPECVPMTFSNDSKLSEVLVLFYDEENPEAPVRGHLIPRNTNYENVTLYILPTERTVLIFDPVIENGNTVVAPTPPTVDVFNALYESYRLLSDSPKNEVHLSCSEYEENDVMIVHIYETMEERRLYTKPETTY